MPILLVQSPCIGVCKLDGAGECTGCGRSKKEIKRWKSMAPAERHDVNMRLLVTEGKAVRKKLLAPLRRDHRRGKL